MALYRNRNIITILQETENGFSKYSLQDLSNRFKIPKTTMQRFLKARGITMEITPERRKFTSEKIAAVKKLKITRRRDIIRQISDAIVEKWGKLHKMDPRRANEQFMTAYENAVQESKMPKKTWNNMSYHDKFATLIETDLRKKTYSELEAISKKIFGATSGNQQP